MDRTLQVVCSLFEASSFGVASAIGAYVALGYVGVTGPLTLTIAGVVGTLVACVVGSVSYLFTIKNDEPFPVVRFLLDPGPY